MKLAEALRIAHSAASDQLPAFRAFLACGFEPLHMVPFLAAHLKGRFPSMSVQVETGVYGDITGNIARLAHSNASQGVVVLEWPDFDLRLGSRTAEGFLPAALPSMLDEAARRKKAILEAVSAAGKLVPVAVALPSLPLPPVFLQRPHHLAPEEAMLKALVATLGAELARAPGVRVLSPDLLLGTSPFAGRHNLKNEIATGFPYSTVHADCLAAALLELSVPPATKKGIITDLDGTLWQGVLGEDGVDGVRWGLEQGAMHHALYQRLLLSLESSGILIAVASKNDRNLVEQAFERPDIGLPLAKVFPVEAHWQAKSGSVARILETWNVGPESVVFIDDSPMELAEVKGAFDEMECLQFHPTDEGVLALISRLRSLFGREQVLEEDLLRARSIRDSVAQREALEGGADQDEFLAAAQGQVRIEVSRDVTDRRAFELINKTNQFNLNGARVLEAEWSRLLSDPNAFLLTASYTDKYSPLGKIAVILGHVVGKTPEISTWVMSCRAFSRRIEYACLQSLFTLFDAKEIRLAYTPTKRNGPTQEFLQALLGFSPDGPVSLTRDRFDRNGLTVHHAITTEKR